MKATSKLQILILSLLLLPALTAAADNDTFEETLTVPEGTMLDVATGSGSIEISAGSGREVSIIGKVKVNRKSFWRRAVDKEEILAQVLANPPVQLEGNQLSVGRFEDRSIGKRVSVSYVIVVPADTSIAADTGSGSITVTDIAAPVEASAGSGRLTLKNIGGPVRARAGSGRIHAEQVAGEFSGRAGSGSISLSQTAPGDVTVSTGSGSIELAGIDGALKASAGSGSITADGRQQGDWTLDTGSGSITVRLPDDAAFALDAESRSGSITVDHPLLVQGKISKRHIRGEVRGGGPLLKVDTGSGSIRVR
jgi:DUF4097 and DUF4098 domain-containing protein YvlB